MEKNKMLIGDAAEYLGVHKSTLRRWDSTGQLKSNRTLGGYRYYLKEDLDDFLDGYTDFNLQCTSGDDKAKAVFMEMFRSFSESIDKKKLLKDKDE